MIDANKYYTDSFSEIGYSKLSTTDRVRSIGKTLAEFSLTSTGENIFGEADSVASLRSNAALQLSRQIEMLIKIQKSLEE